MNSYCKCYGCRYSMTHTTKGHLCGKCKKFGHGNYECLKFNLKRNLYQFYEEKLPVELQCSIENCEYKWSHTNQAHHCKVCKLNHSINDCPNNNIEICCPLCRVKNIIPINQKKITGLSEICKICFDKECQVYFPQCAHICMCIDCVNQLNPNKNNILLGRSNFVIDRRKELTESDIIIASSESQFVELLDVGNKKMENKLNKIYTLIYIGQGCSLYVRRDDFIDEKPIELKGFFMHGDSWGQYGINTDDSRKMEMFIKDYKLID